MQKREQTFTTKFQKWLKYEWLDSNAYFELKSSEPDQLSIPFSSVKEHQARNLKLKRIIHKFSDAFRTGTMFDIILCEGKGYVVLYFWRKGNKEFFIIPIDKWEIEQVISKRKSITEEKARQLSGSYFLK